MVFTYYYVLGVPYSCGVVLVILVLAGNSIWCYVRTQCTIQIVIMTGKKSSSLKKKSSSHLSGRCAIVITTGKKSSSRDFTLICS